MTGLAHITMPSPGPSLHGLANLGDSHGLSPRAARMYTRFYNQKHVMLSDLPHQQMLSQTLQKLLDEHPELRSQTGVAAYTKTQTHNTPAETDWLRASFDEVGLGHWEVLTLSMTNCASALVAVHAFATPNTPLVVLSGEKAFHSAGNRLAVGVLGEAPVAALFHRNGRHALRSSYVRHLPRFHINPDDMDEVDKKAMGQAFEDAFTQFLDGCCQSDPDFFARKPVLIPYNLNVPLVSRVLAKLDLDHLVHPDHSGRDGHNFCSDILLNLAQLPIRPTDPVFVFCAGMGVTYAALAFEPASDAPPSTQSCET